MKLAYKLLYGTFLAAVLVIGGFLILSVAPIPGHIEMKIVKSGSMTPAIPVGALVVIKPESSYAVGDVITFGADTATQIPTTHRIYAITGSGASELITTKGDANDGPDPTQTTPALVHGSVIFSIPYIGYLLAFAKTKLGFLLLIGVPALAVCLEEALKIIEELKAMRKKKRGERNTMPARALQPRPKVPAAYAQSKTARRTPQAPVRPVITIVRVSDGIIPPPIKPSDKVRMNVIYEPGHTLRLRSSSVGIAVAAMLVVGVTTARASGDTLSYYRSSETSPDNVFRSGTYPTDPPPVDPAVAGPDISSASFLTDAPPDSTDSTSTDSTSTDATSTDTTPPPPDPDTSTTTSDTSTSTPDTGQNQSNDPTPPTSDTTGTSDASSTGSSSTGN